MRLVVTSVLLLSVIITYFTTGVESKKCRDGVHNVITIDSYGNETLPVEVRKIRIHVYDHDMKPSCYKRKVNVVMPGWFKIKSGEVDTSRDYDIVKDGAVSVSVSLDGDHICLNGHSDMFIVPESLCSFEMSTFVPKDICETLQQKGLHTLEEIEKKTGFNSTLEIPASPSFLGISLLDVLKGNYRIKISIASEGKKIVEFALPTGYTDLKMGLNEADDED
ncbi:hypothetical protein GCK72_004417 [Caenorhabditis remanei]|uniref:Uncharacterized protein n=1 Tax=Caenorhabditis remanei TaxID=31234 RepID=A0A6A5HBT3_CAERE|nr:hypothetical protein GCK72_004417 [Caenorhabditis remanei]KAF1764469.1 hypothetical protein GCK72_004417 [Caenorhabditis remanei]